MTTYNKSKSRLADIQIKLATQSKINKPSDNPLSNSRIMGMQNQLNTIETYKSNVSYASSILNDSIIAMEAMENEIKNVQVQLTQLNSGIVNEDLTTFAQAINASLEILIELANSDFNGQYSFAGTESGSKPYYYDKSTGRVMSASEYIGGDKVVKISPGIIQKFNISGNELFNSVVKQSGNLNSSAGIGTLQSDSSTIYDADGNEYTLNLDYNMTDANTYELTYSIFDSESNLIESKTVSDIKFDPESGDFKSIGLEKFGEIKVQIPNNKIDFIIDLNSLSETDSSANLRTSLNQKADIFNTLISIRDQLYNGEKPPANQVEMVNEFHQHLLNNLSTAGGILNKLDATEEILFNKETEISDLLSLEKDVDIAQALIDLESAQYTLDISYQISSMILPKSLLDYL
jgi:flagellar hook-associated protein 3 FlgL